MLRIFTILIALGLAACGQPQSSDPTLAWGVARVGENLYQTSNADVFAGDPTKRMLKQCQLEGKQPSVISNVVNQHIYSGTPYSVILFKCI